MKIVNEWTKATLTSVRFCVSRTARG